jgi:Flp pilus assembly pilin Flp
VSIRGLFENVSDSVCYVGIVAALWRDDVSRGVEAAVVRLAGRGLGQSMVEYAIVVALVAVACLGAVQALGGGISQVFQNLLGRIQNLGR